jgi:hypothetical protein
MANIDIAGSAPAAQLPDHTVVRLFCSTFGALLAVLGDLVNNGNSAMLLKLREVLKTNVAPHFEQTFMVVILVVAISLCLFVVRPPRGRGEAFAQGLAVFAVFTTLAPFKDPAMTTDIRLSMLEPPPSIGSLFIAPARAASMGETRSRTITVTFEGGQAPAPGARVVIRSATSGLAIGQKRLDRSANAVTITAPVGTYDLDVEADGFERTRARVTIASAAQPPATVVVPRSSVPLPLQQLYAPKRTRGL